MKKILFSAFLFLLFSQACLASFFDTNYYVITSKYTNQSCYNCTNDFDQSLNTTDNVTFSGLTVNYPDIGNIPLKFESVFGSYPSISLPAGWPLVMNVSLFGVLADNPGIVFVDTEGGGPYLATFNFNGALNKITFSPDLDLEVDDLWANDLFLSGSFSISTFIATTGIIVNTTELDWLSYEILTFQGSYGGLAAFNPSGLPEGQHYCLSGEPGSWEAGNQICVPESDNGNDFWIGRGITANKIIIGNNDLIIKPNKTIEVNATVNIQGLNGSGNAYACLDENGTLYRSGVACA